MRADEVLIGEQVDSDLAVENRLRPVSLDEFVGQERICANLRVFIRAALESGEAMDHARFHGPPGLGKTALAHVLVIVVILGAAHIGVIRRIF